MRATSWYSNARRYPRSSCAPHAHRLATVRERVRLTVVHLLLPSRAVMERALVLLPMVSAAVGYLLDGGVGAASGLFIPLGPLLLAWLLGTR